MERVLECATCTQHTKRVLIWRSAHDYCERIRSLRRMPNTLKVGRDREGLVLPT